MRSIKTALTALGAKGLSDEVDAVMGEGCNWINEIATRCHAISVHRGWWDRERNLGEMIALIHSELSEALEGARKDLQSDHLPKFSMLEEELADALIRIFDLAKAAGLDLGAALWAKMQFNLTRQDHDRAVRENGGKQF